MNLSLRSARGVFAVLVVSSAGGACLEDVDIGAFNQAVATGGTAGAGGTLVLGGAPGEPSGGAGGTGECEPTACLGQIYQCGDCLDNDQDGVADADDPQCVGLCDNTEDSFYGGIPGQNNTPCRQDCYFDRDSGPGNDGCYWNHACDELSVAPSYPPSGDDACLYDPDANTGTSASCDELALEQPPECLDYCRPLTPNGCDCFGCCELPARSGSYVWLGSTSNGVGSCDADSLDDPAACRPCTPVPSCLNACDDCEVCVGETTPPPDCSGSSNCDGLPSCGPGASCGSGSYCITGCCVAAPR